MICQLMCHLPIQLQAVIRHPFYIQNNQMLNTEVTQKISQEEKYKTFIAWGLKNGVLMNDVEIPCAFGPLGIPGVGAKTDIPSNKAIIAVPYHMIITLDKVRESEMKVIIEAFPNLFDEGTTHDAEFNILAVFVYMERKKGEGSFFKPYFDVAQSGNTLFEWSVEDLAMIDNKALLEEFLKLKVEMEELWLQIKEVLEKFPEIYGEPDANDRSLFYSSYELVMTRCFGWSLKSTSLVPFADMLNHSNNATTHHMIHTVLENGETFDDLKKAKAAEEQYFPKKDKIDLSLLHIEQQNLEQLHHLTDKKISLIRQKKVFLEDIYREEVEKRKDSEFIAQEKSLLVNKINKKLLNTDKDIQVWNLTFATTSNSEDNDTDEDVVKIRQSHQQNIKAKEIFSYQLLLEDINKRKKGEDKGKEAPSKTDRDDEWKHQKLGISGDELKERIEQIQKGTLDANSSEGIQILSLIQFPQEEGFFKNEQEQDNQDDEEEEEEDEEEQDTENEWDWLSESDKQAYFVIVTKNAIKKNEEVHVSYGRRTNRFLLVWYGFVIENNKYSSFNFRLRMQKDHKATNIDDKLFKEMIIYKIIRREEFFANQFEYEGKVIPLNEVTSEFKIKKNVLCLDLIQYIRLFMLVYYKGAETRRLFITIPISIEYEIFVFQFAVSLLSYLIKDHSTSIEEDREILQSSQSWKERFATIMNLEGKEILMNQLLIVLDCLILLKRLKGTSNFRDEYLNLCKTSKKDIEILRPLKMYLKDLYTGIFKNGLDRDLQYIL